MDLMTLAALKQLGGGSASEPYVEYTLDENGEITAAKLYGFTSIPTALFAYSFSLESVDFSESPGLTSIGDYAFLNCASLDLPSLPAGITSIGEGAFENCSSLTLTSLPNSVTSMGEGAFSGCENLALTTLPSGLTEISAYLFTGCTSLALTSLPSGITSVGESALAECAGLVNIEIASQALGTEAFVGCSGLQRVWLRNSCASISATSARSSPFAKCPASLNIYAEPGAALPGWGAYYNRTGSAGDTVVNVTFGQTTRPW